MCKPAPFGGALLLASPPEPGTVEDAAAAPGGPASTPLTSPSEEPGSWLNAAVDEGGGGRGDSEPPGVGPWTDVLKKQQRIGTRAGGGSGKLGTQ